MGKNDLGPGTIDLNLNVNLAFEILYQYEYIALVERLNYGTITSCLRIQIETSTKMYTPFWIG